MAQISHHSASVTCKNLISLVNDTETTLWVFFYILSEDKFEFCVESAHILKRLFHFFGGFRWLTVFGNSLRDTYPTNMQLKNSVIAMEHFVCSFVRLCLSVYVCEQIPASPLGMPKADQAVLFLEKGKSSRAGGINQALSLSL